MACRFITIDKRILVAGACLGCLLVIGLMGFWIATAEEPAARSETPPTPGEPFSLAHIPRDAVLVIASRPAALIRREAVAPLRETIVQIGREKLNFDLAPEEVSQFLLIVLSAPNAEPAVAMIVHTASALSATRLISSFGSDAEPQEFADQSYFRLGSGICLFQADDQTVVVSPQEATLRRCIAAGAQGASTTNWAARWETVAAQDVAALVNTSLLRAADPSLAAAVLGRLYSDRSGQSQAGLQLAYQLAPLWRRSDNVVASLQVSEEISLRVIAQSANEDEAREFQAALLTAVSAIRSALSAGRAALAEAPSAAAPSLLQNIDLVDEVLEKAQVVRRNEQVGLVARVDENAAKRLASLLPPAAMAAREASSRTQTANNLKRIALAMHNYHDVYSTFPAAVQIGPKNTPRSWRVTILPFLEQMPLYEQYRQDEPWDSENNNQVLAKIPDVYRCPLDRPGSTNTSCFTLVGRETVSPGDRGSRMAEITDGTSNTLMFVESKQETPWTKPEDIPFDAQKPPPKPGGWYPQGFWGALCDGSVHYFADDQLDEQTLRFLIIKNDGNIVRIPR